MRGGDIKVLHHQGIERFIRIIAQRSDTDILLIERYDGFAETLADQ
ncbi:hypothetical protein [Thiomonas sp. FB-Cd]|nr:hypothetical protein [Thiomonas sp. FB-Cd]